MRSRTARIAPLALSLVLAGCSEEQSAPPEAREPRASTESAATARAVPGGLVAPSALARALPDALGSFVVTGEPEPHVEAGLVPTTRVTVRYRDGDRRAELRVVDAARSPELVAGFAAAQQIPMPPGERGEELLPTGVAGRPALASWTPDTATSEAQVLVSERFVVALAVSPAREPEEAVELLDALPLAPLDALAR